MRRSFKNMIFLPATFCAVLVLSSCAAEHAAPVHHLGTHLDSTAGAVMVREGETLWSIAQRYRLSQRDIIDLNGLKPPYHLADGQRLRLPPPMEYRVGANDTLTGIARMYGVPSSKIAQMNSVSAPYRLQQGQVLRIPSTVKRQQEQKRIVAATQKSIMPPQPKPVPNNTTPQSTTTVIRAAPKPVVVSKPPSTRMPAPSKPVTTVSKVSRQGFIWPVKGKVISSYGPKAGHLHNDGINIAAPRGTAVAAAADGTVAYVGDALSGYGNLVLLRHDNGMVTAYAHLDRVTVSKGMRVRQGQAIGTVGSTGTVANAQLHFEIRKGIETLDPKRYLS